MTQAIQNTLLQVGSPIFEVIIVIIASTILHLSWKKIGVLWPQWRQALFWILAYIALAILKEIFSRMTGSGATEPWGNRYPPTIVILRIIGIVILAPFGEELLFRGLLFERLGVRFGPIAAIILTSIAFGLAHIQYEPLGMILVLVDGLFFGFVRYRTGSMLVTFFCHSLNNLYVALFLLGVLNF